MEEDFFFEEVVDEIDDEDDLTISKKSSQSLEEHLPASIKDTSQTATQRSIKSAMRIFFQFICSNGIEINLETASKEEIAMVMRKFFLQVKKSDGEMYKRKTYCCVKFGLIHGLKEIRPDINFAYDKEFINVMHAFKLTLHKLKVLGKPTEHNQKISPKDLEKLYKCGIFGTDRPTALQNKVFFEILFFLLCSRGRGYMRQLQPSDITIKQNKNGRKYAQLVNLQETSPSAEDYSNQFDEDALESVLDKTKSRTGYVFELRGHPKCPVASLEKYLSKLPPQATFLFAQSTDRMVVKQGTGSNLDYDGCRNSVWYMNSALGKNSLRGLMREISKQGELSKSYSNFCIYHTSMSLLHSKGYDVKAFLDGRLVTAENGTVDSIETDLDLAEKMSDVLAEALFSDKTEYLNPNCSMYVLPTQDIQDGETHESIVTIPGSTAASIGVEPTQSPIATASPALSTPHVIKILPKTCVVNSIPHVFMQPIKPGETLHIQPLATQNVSYNPPKIQMIHPNVISSAPSPQNIVRPLGTSQFILKTEPNSSQDHLDVGPHSVSVPTSSGVVASDQNVMVTASQGLQHRSWSSVSWLGNQSPTTGIVLPSSDIQQLSNGPSENQMDIDTNSNPIIINLQRALNEKNQQLQTNTLKINQLEVYQSEYKRLLQEVNVLQQHLSSYQTNTKELQTKIRNMKQERQTRCDISFEQLCYNNTLFRYYTGFSRKEFAVLFQFLDTEYSVEPYRRKRPNLSVRNQLLLTLCKLRHNFTFIDLGHRFGVTKVTAKNMFISWLNHMSQKFEEVYIWPHRETLKAHLPRHFQQDFPNTLALVKSINIKVCQPPSRLRHGILAVDPRGCVIGCSHLVAGSLSDDSDLLERSGFKSKLRMLVDSGRLQNGDGILAENLDIGAGLNDFGLKLNDVAFSKCDIDDDLKSVLQTQRVQTHKILIDKALCRIRKFRIISQTVPSSLVSNSDKIFQVVSFLTNFMPPLSLDVNE